MKQRLINCVTRNAWACLMIGVSLLAVCLPNGEKLLRDIYDNTDPTFWDDYDEGEG